VKPTISQREMGYAEERVVATVISPSFGLETTDDFPAADHIEILSTRDHCASSN
jgi:hypothetical protein